jgi:protocatechuate 3,4-dioxygenase, beta subunit
MSLTIYRPSRRALLGSFTLGAGAFLAPGAFAEELFKTPAQTEGPFYPDQLPLDKDNNLIIVNNDTTAAVGTVTNLFGRVLDSKGEPVKNAVIEIWQVDNNGAYLHTKDPNRAKRDSHFQGYGKFETDSTGEYRFLTIKPVPYPGRTPHIHVKVSKGERELLTTQCYIEAERERNMQDGIYRSLKTEQERKALTVSFAPLKGSKLAGLAAKFDIVLGVTPKA